MDRPQDKNILLPDTVDCQILFVNNKTISAFHSTRKKDSPSGFRILIELFRHIQQSGHDIIRCR